MFLLEIRCTCTEGTFSNKYCRPRLWFLIPLLISTPITTFVLCGLSIFCLKNSEPLPDNLGQFKPRRELDNRLSRDSRLLLYLSITAQDKLLVHKMLLPLLSGFINRLIFRGHSTYVRPDPEGLIETFEIAGARFVLQTGCPFRQPANSVRALKLSSLKVRH